jgi:hypothetical protein
LTPDADDGQRLVSRQLPSLLILLLLLAMPLASSAQIDETDRFDISLVTVGPGSVYWQRFGHNAILIRERGSADPGVIYNYGLFDFQQKNFFLNFIRGHMTYRIAAFYADQDLASYVNDDRDVFIQELNLDSEQRRALIEFLEWNRRPENADYRYDYFLSNCSTRVRDVLDSVLGGALEDHYSAQAGTLNFRQHVQRLTAPDLALYLGTGLGLGRIVDLKRNRWDEFFIPMELMRSLEQFEGSDGSSLVRKTTELHRSQRPEPEVAPQWLLPFFGVGLLLASVLALTRRKTSLFLRSAGIWYLLTGFAGLVLVMLWLFTDHQAAWYNENLLLFSPLGLLAAGPLLFARLTPLARTVTQWIAGLAILGVALKLSPWLFQDNLEFAALLLPGHLLICLGLLNHDHWPPTKDTGPATRLSEQ